MSRANVPTAGAGPLSVLLASKIPDDVAEAWLQADSTARLTLVLMD